MALFPSYRTAAKLPACGLAIVLAMACTSNPLRETASRADAGRADSLALDGPPELRSIDDAADSLWLLVIKDGSGVGSVSSTPGGIFCGGTCSFEFAVGTMVTLTAHPSATSTFAGWSGACSGTGLCSVTMDEVRSVTAVFDLTRHNLTVAPTGAGSGTISSLPSNIDCGSSCTTNFETGTVVMLIATADGTSLFTGWSGACIGANTCNVTLDADRRVTANFAVLQEGLHVAKSGNGDGTVESFPPGLSCGTACSAQFAFGTEITLVASPAPHSTFTGWSGVCSGIATCTIVTGSAQSVTANFDQVQYGLSITKSGTGSGTIMSSPLGISSSSSCAATYGTATVVTLTASPDQASTFTGWSGACNGDGICTVTMDMSKEVTANFDTIQYLLTVAKIGTGSILSVPAGISCGSSCEAPFPIGSAVTLTAIPDTASQFLGWSGACSGLGKCVITLNAAQAAGATFSSLHME